MANHLWNLRQGGAHASNRAPISPSNGLWWVKSVNTPTTPFFNSKKFSPTQHVHPNCNPPIACRLCDKVFLSIEALMNHIDSHIAHEENNLGTLNIPQQQITSGRGQVLNRFSPNISMPMKMQEIRSLADNMTFRAPQRPAAMVPTRRHSFGSGGARVLRPPVQHTQPPLRRHSSVSRNNNVRARMDFSQFQLLKMKGSPSDGTRPYIKQLEKPIKSIEIIDLVAEDNDLQALDLSLKL